MGIFSNFFMSESEKANLEKAKRRKIVRGVENIISGLEEKSMILGKECSTLWDKARQQLMSGQKNEAAATLRFYKSKNVMSRRIEQQLMLVRHRYDTLTGAADMQEVAGALNSLAGVMGVDVDALEESMEAVADAASDTADVNRAVDAAFQRDMARLDRELEAGGSDDDDALMKALEQEIAGAGAASAGGVISEGQDRLRNMLDGKK